MLDLQSTCASLQEEGLGSDWWFPEARESLTSDRLAYCIAEDELVPKTNWSRRGHELDTIKAQRQSLEPWLLLKYTTE